VIQHERFWQRAMHLVVAVVAAISFPCAGCSASLGKSVGDGLMTAVEPKAASLGRGFAAGARDVLTSPETAERLQRLEQTLIEGLRDPLTSDDTKKRLLAMELALLEGGRDALTSEETIARFVKLEDALLSKAATDLVALRRQLLGDELRAELRAIVREIGPEAGQAVALAVTHALGSAAQERVGALREELVGKPARDAATALVDAMTREFVLRWDQDLRPRLRHEERWVIAVATVVVALLGVLASLIFRRATKYRNLVGILVDKIDRIEEQRVYDALTKQISADARSRDLERLLRDVLQEKGVNDVRAV
jgi:hypothetical protein